MKNVEEQSQAPQNRLVVVVMRKMTQEVFGLGFGPTVGQIQAVRIALSISLRLRIKEYSDLMNSLPNNRLLANENLKILYQ